MKGDSLTLTSLAIWLGWLTLVSIAGDISFDPLLFYGSTPLLSLSLLAYVLWLAPAPRRHVALIVTLGLSFISDVCLMLYRDIDLFIPGILAFFGMQVGYVVLLVRSIRREGQPVAYWQLALVGLATGAFVVYAIRLFRPHFQTPDLAPAWPGIVANAIWLGGLILTGMWWQRAVAPQRFPMVTIGVVMLMLTALLTAYTRFVAPIYLAALWIMATSTAGHFCVIIGYTTQPAPVPNDPTPVLA